MTYFIDTSGFFALFDADDWLDAMAFDRHFKDQRRRWRKAAR